MNSILIIQILALIALAKKYWRIGMIYTRLATDWLEGARARDSTQLTGFLHKICENLLEKQA